jgi:hypothetical protein
MNESDRELKRRELWERYEVAKRKKATLLGERFYTPLKEEHYQNSITLEKLPLVKELCIQDKATFPYALFLQLAILATHTIDLNLYKVQFQAPLQLDEGETRILHTVTHELFDPQHGGDSKQFEIYSSDKNKSKWVLHCTGFAVAVGSEWHGLEKADIAEIKERYPTPIDFKLIYEQVKKEGIILGEDLRGITEMSKNDKGLVAHVRFPMPKQSNELTYSIPAILETCFHAVFAFFVRPGFERPVITSIEMFFLHHWPTEDVWCVVESDYSKTIHYANLWIYNAEGKQVGLMIGIRLEYISPR